MVLVNFHQMARLFGVKTAYKQNSLRHVLPPVLHESELGYGTRPRPTPRPTPIPTTPRPTPRPPDSWWQDYHRCIVDHARDHIKDLPVGKKPRFPFKAFDSECEKRAKSFRQKIDPNSRKSFAELSGP